jgi:hypothetical protein
VASWEQLREKAGSKLDRVVDDFIKDIEVNFPVATKQEKHNATENILNAELRRAIERWFRRG